jgi:hypothetical protein
MLRKLLYVLSLTLFIALLIPFTVSAHGVTQVSDYELVIGFHNEPAYQGEPNSLDPFVTNIVTNESVKGLEETLRVEIINGASKQELPIRAHFGQDGAYTADVLPTEAGEFAFPAAEPMLAELQNQSQMALTIGILGAVMGFLGMCTK